jgi:hypothetical protein
LSSDYDEDISDSIRDTLNRFFRANDPAKTTALHEEYEARGDRLLHHDTVDMGTMVDYNEVESVEKQQEEDIYEATLSPNSIIFRDELESMVKELRNISVEIECIHSRPIVYKKNKELHSRLVLCLRHNRSKPK